MSPERTTTFQIRESATSPANWDNVDPCYTSTDFDYTDGGHVGFTCGRNYIDDFKVQRWDGDSWEVVVEDDFDIESGFAESQPLHDAAGNLTYDGVYHYVYDAWNRPMKIHIDDGDGAFDSDDDTLVAEFACDGLGRRITKQVKNSADRDSTYHYYYDLAWRRLEVRDGSGYVLKQYVWGTRYIDNIVQIGINTDPEDAGEDDCEDFYYPLQDANFNVVGLADSSGTLKERYEYTPYGERTVYMNAGSDDTKTSAPLYESRRVKVGSIKQPYGLCDIGHQGLFLDPEFGLYDNRHRVLHPRLRRFMQRDPIGYAHNHNLYEYCTTSPLVHLDPDGSRAVRHQPVRQAPPTWGLTTNLPAYQGPRGDIPVDAWTEPDRKGKPRAKVCCKKPGCTWLQLAHKIRLNETEYHRWAKRADGAGGSDVPNPPEVGWYTVPNKAYVDWASYPVSWFIDRFNLTVAWQTGYFKTLRAMWQQQRLDVEYAVVGHVGGTDILEHMSDENLYKYAVIAHGNPGGNLDRLPSRAGSSQHNYSLPAGKWTRYGIAELHVIACHSNASATAWGQNVSHFGRLTTLVGDFTWIDAVRQRLGGDYIKRESGMALR